MRSYCGFRAWQEMYCGFRVWQEVLIWCQDGVDEGTAVNLAQGTELPNSMLHTANHFALYQLLVNGQHVATCLYLKF